MAHRIEQSLTVSIPAHKVWAVLSDYSAVERFAPTVKSSSIVGDKHSGIGAKRRVTLHHDGSSMIEEITEYDEGEGYKMEVSELSSPLKSMQAELRVKDLDGGSSEIFMALDFQTKGGPFGWLMSQLMLKPIMKGVLKKQVNGLAFHSATGKLVDEKLPPNAELTVAIGSVS